MMYRTRIVESPSARRRSRRRWWRSWEGRVCRREAVETVKEMVVGEGRRVARWGRVVSIGVDWDVIS